MSLTSIDIMACVSNHVHINGYDALIVTAI